MKHFFRWLKAMISREMYNPDDPDKLLEQARREAQDAGEQTRRDIQDVLDKVRGRWK